MGIVVVVRSARRENRLPATRRTPAAIAHWLAGEGATVEMGVKPDFSTAEAMEVYTMLLRAATSKLLSDRFGPLPGY